MAEIPRAERFPIQIPLRYRAVGQERWLEGRIENISGSGVLFRAREPLPPKTSLEMSFALELGPIADFAPEVLCSGHVVRIVPPGEVGGDPALAAAILNYEFVRRKQDPQP